MRPEVLPPAPGTEHHQLPAEVAGTSLIERCRLACKSRRVFLAIVVFAFILTSVAAMLLAGGDTLGKVWRLFQ